MHFFRFGSVGPRFQTTLKTVLDAIADIENAYALLVHTSSQTHNHRNK